MKKTIFFSNFLNLISFFEKLLFHYFFELSIVILISNSSVSFCSFFRCSWLIIALITFCFTTLSVSFIISNQEDSQIDNFWSLIILSLILEIFMTMSLKISVSQKNSYQLSKIKDYSALCDINPFYHLSHM